jgi:FkbM family methyltransferase
MQFLYGTKKNNIDITDIVYKKCIRNNIIFISNDIDERIKLFGESPSESIISVKNNDTTTRFDNTKRIFIDLTNNTIIDESESSNNDKINYCISLFDKNSRLHNIHSTLSLDFGSFSEELPEQLMVSKYLTGNEKVLEIGGNIGRNTLVIASILNKNNNNNLVSLESDSDISVQLTHNKNKNNLDFYVESAALSKRKLIQKGWDTIPSDIILDGYKQINTIDYDTLIQKYNIQFDTLIADCEGALYYILYDMSELLQNINLIIMENDYWDINKKKFVDNILKSYNFVPDYQEAGGWGPYYDRFFEVWIKTKEYNVNQENIINIKLKEDIRLLNNETDNKINLLKSDISALSNRLQQKDNTISELQNQINQKDNIIYNLNDQLHQKDNIIYNLNDQLHQKDNMINNLQNELSQSNAQTEQVKRQNATLFMSKMRR